MEGSEAILNEIKRKVYAQDVLNRLGSTYKPKMYPEFRSQFGEDMVAWDILGNQIEGSYLEVGGFDGLSYSVTSVFDAMGWDGLLIEPILSKHVESLKNRPNAAHIHAAIGSKQASGTVAFTEVIGAAMFSGVGELDIQEQLAASKMPRKTSLVPYMPMDQALESIWPGGKCLDLAVIDVEGHECELLDGFSLNRWRPRLIIIEDNSFGQSTAINCFFENDYVLLGTLACNRIYGRKDDTQIMRWRNPTA